MSTILELTEKQKKLKDQIFFEDDEILLGQLIREAVQTLHTIENKLQFAADIQFELELEADAKREAARVTQKRAITAENKANRLKEFILEVMSEQGLKRIDGVYRGLSRCQRETLIVRDETKIPSAFFMPQPAKLLKSELNNAIKQHLIDAELCGCEMATVDYLRAV
jgi:hypothetical protein